MHYDIDPGVKVVNISFHPVHFSAYGKYGEDYLPLRFPCSRRLLLLIHPCSLRQSLHVQSVRRALLSNS